MRFFVTAEPSSTGFDRLDAQSGGPGPLFAQIAERFKPEAFFVRADRRVAYWIVDLPDAAAVTDLMTLLVHKADASPVMVPILTGDEVRTVLPAAAERARR